MTPPVSPDIGPPSDIPPMVTSPSMSVIISEGAPSSLIPAAAASAAASFAASAAATAAAARFRARRSSFLARFSSFSALAFAFSSFLRRRSARSASSASSSTSFTACAAPARTAFRASSRALASAASFSSANPVSPFAAWSSASAADAVSAPARRAAIRNDVDAHSKMSKPCESFEPASPPPSGAPRVSDASCAGASSVDKIPSRASQSIAARTPPLRSALHASVVNARARATPHCPPCLASMPNWSDAAARRTAGHGSSMPARTKDRPVSTASATTAPRAASARRFFSRASSSPSSASALPPRRLDLGSAASAFFASFAALNDSGSGGMRLRRERSASIPATVTRRPPSCALPPTPQMFAFSRMRLAIARTI